MFGDTLARLRDTLTTIARQQDITIIAARDIGSHAWELAGPASDYDVGFLFAQEPLAYATLGEYRPSINETRETIELTGWNVTRFDELLTESNPTALEFLHSPVRYREHDALAALEADVSDDFVPIDHGVWKNRKAVGPTLVTTSCRSTCITTTARSPRIIIRRLSNDGSSTVAR